jgi:hypothetical protein
MTFHEDFHPQNCPSKSATPQQAATLGAGVQVYEMYQEADKHGLAMIGGANPVGPTNQVCDLVNADDIITDRWRRGLVHGRRTWAHDE